MKIWKSELDLTNVTGRSYHWCPLTGIEIVVGHRAWSDKNGYMSGTHISKLDILSCALSLSVICGKSFNPLKTRLAYCKSIIKSLYTFIQRTIKWEHTRCRRLSLFTFTLNSGDSWSFYLSKVFLKNIKSTCMTWLLLNCFLSWKRFF